VISIFKKVMRQVLSLPQIQKLKYFSSHNLETPTPTNNRLKHSIRIAFLAFKISPLFFQDPSYCTRAGLLHDIGYAIVTPEFTRTHFFDHALAGFYLVKKQFHEPPQILQAIRTHMFPMSPPPKSLFALVIWLADKLDWILFILKLTPWLDRHIAAILKR